MKKMQGKNIIGNEIKYIKKNSFLMQKFFENLNQPFDIFTQKLYISQIF